MELKRAKEVLEDDWNTDVIRQLEAIATWMCDPEGVVKA